MKIDFIKYAKQIGETEDFDCFWKACQNLFHETLLWENVSRLKKEEALGYLINVFTDIKSEDEKFGKKVLDAQKRGDYQKIGDSIALVTLSHLLEDKGVKIDDVKKLDISRDLYPKLSGEITLPLFVLESLAFGPISKQVNSFKQKNLERYLTLLTGLWVEIYDNLYIEKDLSIVNPKRKKQIEEFVGKTSRAMSKYYDILEESLQYNEMKREMKKLIKSDPDFLDPYLVLADILEEEDNYGEAREVLREAYLRAMNFIVDKNGNWPKILPWEVLENRHIIRAINRWACALWEEDRPEYSLEIFRKLLKSNPSDNIGARYAVLAIRLGLDCNYEDQFESKSTPGYIDAGEMIDWFEKYSEAFPEEFGWWWKTIK